MSRIVRTSVAALAQLALVVLATPAHAWCVRNATDAANLQFAVGRNPAVSLEAGRQFCSADHGRQTAEQAAASQLLSVTVYLPSGSLGCEAGEKGQKGQMGQPGGACVRSCGGSDPKAAMGVVLRNTDTLAIDIYQRDMYADAPRGTVFADITNMQGVQQARTLCLR